MRRPADIVRRARLLSQEALVTPRFRTIYVEEYLGHGSENRWSLALEQGTATQREHLTFEPD